jgi:hypothetical protein
MWVCKILQFPKSARCFGYSKVIVSKMVKGKPSFEELYAKYKNK